MFLNKIPLSDMNSLCDPCTADVTGRIVECFGLLLLSPRWKIVDEGLLERLSVSAKRGIAYLELQKESFGAWWGRWGCNYVYGTSNVLYGLTTFRKNSETLQRSISRAIKWLKSVQNEDGGWGETVKSYADVTLACIGHTTPSQTTWGVMALLAHLPPSDESIRKGVAWLIAHQAERSKEGAAWPEKHFTATGFPLYLYLEYSYYPHYFPMMALGRFVKESQKQSR
jgi:squalene-hopene/tetraprenyl-beta-curcumene cyclase